MPKTNKINPTLTELNFREFCKDVKALKQTDNRFIGFDYKGFIHTFKTVAHFMGYSPGCRLVNIFDIPYIGSSGSVVFKEKVMPNVVTYKEHDARGQKTAYEEQYDAVVINLKPIHAQTTKVRLAISAPTYGAPQVAVQLKFDGSEKWATIHCKPQNVKLILEDLNF